MLIYRMIPNNTEWANGHVGIVAYVGDDFVLVAEDNYFYYWEY